MKWKSGYKMIKNIWNGILGILFWMVIITYILPNPKSSIQWVIAILIIFLAIASIFGVIALKEYFEKYPKCSHGVRGGYNYRKCPICQNIRITEDLAAAKEEKKRILENKKQAALKQIKLDSEILRNAEAIRIRSLKMTKIKELQDVSPREFENIIALLFKNLGYEVKQTPYTNDGGKDAIAWMNGKKYVIECKRYAENAAIGRPMVQKFHSALIDEKAVGGYFVTTSKFAQTAIDYGKKHNLTLIDGNSLENLFSKAYPEYNESIMFNQMCIECGEIVEFDLSESGDMKACPNGHKVVKSIPYIDEIAATGKSYTTPKKKKYKRYRY